MFIISHATNVPNFSSLVLFNVGNIERLVRSYRNVYQAHLELMRSNQGIRSQTLYRSVYIQHVYHHAKFEFSRFSSLADTKGDGGH